MNQPATVFDFLVNELPAITVSCELAVDLEHGITITRKRLADTFTRVTGAFRAGRVLKNYIRTTKNQKFLTSQYRA